MSTWRSPVLTDAGNKLLTKLMSGNTLAIVDAVSGAGYVDPDLLREQANVTDPKQHLNIEVVNSPDTMQCALICSLTNSGLETGYTANQIGLFAVDPDEGTILFCIMQADVREDTGEPDGTTIPPETGEKGMANYSADWTFNIKFSQTDGINVTVDASNVVTRRWLESYIDTAMAATYDEIDAVMDIDASDISGGSGGSAFVDGDTLVIN